MDARVSTADNSAVFTPHLKKVLKSFQITSMRSLNGPDTCRPVYSLGYMEKDLSSSLLSPFAVTNPSLHAKTNIISADGVYYKKRLKGGRSSGGSLVVTQCGPNSATTTSGASNGPSSLLAKTTGMSGGGDNNNNNNDTTTTSANKSSKNNSLSNAVVAAELSCDVGGGGGVISANGKSNGADCVEGVGRTFNEERDSFESDLFLGPPPFPIQQVPILTAADQGWSESKTQLEGEMISCFVVGGEKRLCLPQILNSVLRQFSLPQINAVCDELLIYCSRCNQEQLGVLKMTGILPPSAPSCGLVTKTDCERLCNALLHRYPPRAVHNLPPDKRPFHFRIYHECFGKCEGVYTPDHFTVPHAKCIECNECHGLLSPQKFVGHVHKALENRTCHWGFDSLSWRSYILVAKGQENMNHLKDQLDEMKERFDNTKNNRKRKSPRTTVIKAEAVDFEEEEGRGTSGQHVAAAVEEEEELEVKEDATVIKKRKSEITDTYYPYVYDPVVACYYGFAPGPCHPHANPSALSRLSAFRPWSPLLTTKEGKFNLSMPPNTVAFVRESAPPPPLPAYLSRGPPVLLNPERVVPISETERFERHYQPNVALAPPSAQVQAKQKSHQTSHAESSPSIGQQRPTVNLSTRPKQQSTPVTSSKRLPESVVASSSSSSGSSSVPTTTAATQQQPIQHRGYSDIELSTDTDETFSDSTTYSASGSPTSCSSRNPVKDGQEKPSSAAEVDAIVAEMKCLRQLLDEEVPDKEVQDKVMGKVARICYIIEQKLEKSELSIRQLSQELDYTRMSKRERLREAAETKRQLRKEMERLYEGNLSLERQINEMRKDSLSLTSSLQRQIVLKREQTDEDDPEEDGLTFVPDLNLDEIHDTQEEEEEQEEDGENRRLEQPMALEQEVEDVKPNLGLLVASVSNGY